MVDDNLVRELARQVVQKLIERQKKALVVYTGTNMGAESALEALRSLQAQGFSFHVLLSRGAYEILDVEKIRKTLEPEALWIERGDEGPEGLAERYDTILVPALSVNSAARIAACMPNTAATAVILNGLMRGKNVVISVDGCCPGSVAHAAHGFRMPTPLQERLQANVETLRSYGAKLTAAANLKDQTLAMLHEAFSYAPNPRCSNSPNPSGSEPATAVASQDARKGFQGKVVSARDVVKYASGGILRLKPGTLITQLAKDEARSRDIVIEIERQSR